MHRPDEVVVALGQFAPIPGDTGANVARMADWVGQARREEPDVGLVLFPELATSGYNMGEAFWDLALRLPDDPALAPLQAAARTAGLFVAVGLPEEDPRHPGLLYDALALIGPDGALAGRYRKVHVLPGEARWFAAGAAYPVWDTPLGRLGPLICWDAAFPEAARASALAGADLLLVAAAWEEPFRHHWGLAVRARALDNAVPVAAVNRTGPDIGLTFFGESALAGPDGQIAAAAPALAEGLVYGRFRHSAVRRYRTEFGQMLKDRRPHTYGPLLQP